MKEYLIENDMEAYVVDDPIPLYDPNFFMDLGKNHIFCSDNMLSEVDKKRKKLDQEGLTARLLAKTLANLIKDMEGSLSDKVELNHGAFFTIVHSPSKGPDDVLPAIRIAEHLHHQGHEVTLWTLNRDLIDKADAFPYAIRWYQKKEGTTETFLPSSIEKKTELTNSVYLVFSEHQHLLRVFDTQQKADDFVMKQKEKGNRQVYWAKREVE